MPRRRSYRDHVVRLRSTACQWCFFTTEIFPEPEFAAIINARVNGQRESGQGVIGVKCLVTGVTILFHTNDYRVTVPNEDRCPSVWTRIWAILGDTWSAAPMVDAMTP